MTIASLKQHAIHEEFDVRDDCLVIGDRSLTQIAAEIGRTPFYLYSRESLMRRARDLRRALPPAVHVHFAVKANPMPDVVRQLAADVDGLDVASAGELRVALASGMNPAEISFAGPGKTVAELELAAVSGIVVNLESEREMRALAAIGDARSIRPRVAVRVNPDFELKTSGMKMSGGPKQFGVDAERVPEMLAELARLPLDFQGFHIFSGSQNLRPEAIVEAQRKTLDLVTQLARGAPAPLKLLNMGGGFGIPYFPGEQALDVQPIARHLEALVPEVRERFPLARMVIELGRYLVGPSGIYVCRVLDRKLSRGQVFLITDGGLHHHLAASGNFGQVIRKNYPVVVGNKVQGREREVASVVGPLCTPLDTLAERMEMARAEVGDLIVVLQSGAYGLTASPLGFLSHPHPAEVLL
ncbi:MAG TPA: pyridoxal-dependent decarboxylase, exosortase A system-associated [Steroidobacteraceae bacterium]|nr:pyridoxal-dependent decarboxylase, exosortase A system-associated [Steroidobacteraceae bacterium]